MTYCHWCDLWLEDGRKESGYTGPGPDWCAEGDYGCDESPETTDECVGPHMTLADVRRVIANYGFPDEMRVYSNGE